MENRGYSIVTIKSMDEDRRIITGMATTPALDSYGDIVEPNGVRSAKNIPLFLYHDSMQTVGRAALGKATSDGVPFTATIPRVLEPGRLQERVDEAWQMVKYKLITGVSIGFRMFADKVEQLKGGGLRFLESEVLELSLVPIPANSEATITAIKSADAQSRALSGLERKSPALGARSSALSGKTSKGNEVKTLTEMLDAQRTKQARVEELIGLRTTEKRSFTPEERTEMQTLQSDIEALDDDIVVQRVNDRKAANATRVGGDPDGQRASRGGVSFVRTADPEDKFKGQSFVRQIKLRALARITGQSIAELAQQQYGRTHPKFVQVVRAAVAGGGTGSGEWGAELAKLDGLYTGDFIEYLYGMTVFDRLPLKEVPARVRVKGQDGQHIGYWVGESKAIPPSAGDYSTIDLTPLKVAALAVVSNELIEDSAPAADALVRDSLVEASSQKVDTTFLSATAASAGVSPAGLLNGLTGIVPSGTDETAVRADLQALAYPFVTNKMASGLVFVMNPAQGLSLGSFVNTFSMPSFPGLNEMGGTLLGRTVYTGDNVTPGQILLMRPQDIWKIGDSGVQVSMSDVATIEMNDAAAGASDTPVDMASHRVSMFQTESTAFKIVRRINFQKRRSTAVVFIDNAEYGGVTS